MSSVFRETVVESDWEQLVIAAEGAGRHSGRELARQCTTWELGRTGQVWVRVRPHDSPVGAWLFSTGRAHSYETGVLVPITPDKQDLVSAARARSLLVCRAYAAAYCAVLVQEAGVLADVLERADELFQQLIGGGELGGSAETTRHFEWERT
ncbi:citrate lyase beta subunit [Saccharopolyspora lacisalsi]|uniref:Citrate lyase beta subunit n=1 Tax=Halosaccharopolyspora lacisalsi TaxID=1000566 RepID=A0A839DU92_9PSEU|nr:hypothetical protein [Halosaccharopolyspora lacisalsi]MBA8824490.1 citrate lyase beta subunit [Halosaccharopolyspora lacisalsi]